ncbi:MAG: adenylosuccinate synthase [Candidatus Neomarinimicrobiota bacterium]
MPVTAVIGGQWGDEGKGKIVDTLCRNMDVVARYQGGANAGHTVKVNDNTFILHQIPSGILHPGCACLLGSGMVVDPVALSEELDQLQKVGIDTQGRVHIGLNAHIVTPVHKAMDRATGDVIGTTRRGIGPAYADKARRLGIRAVDLADLAGTSKYMLDRLKISIQQGEVPPDELANLKADMEEFIAASLIIKPLVGDTIGLLQDALAGGKNILIEGAQGTLLDIDLGTYPFVTSSHPTVGGIATGLGMPARSIDRLIGIFKAYTTRVGSGPFPTELTDDIGQRLQDEGSEFGATTGRPRRCGWFDAVAARYSCQVNGFTEIALTKLDILDNFETIKVCTGYTANNEPVTGLSAVIHALEQVTPVYEELPGWTTPTSSLRSAAKLPKAARAYIRRLEELVGVPVKQVSIGAERSQILSL